MSNEPEWIIANQNELPSQPVMDYIKQKGAELAKVTEGKLTAVLVRAGVSWKDVATTLADAFDGITNGHYHATLSKDATDASNLYKKKTYEFLIVDDIHKYELSLFQITCNDILPASLLIEPTIAEEASLQKHIEIDNLEKFKEVFEEIIHCRKVIYIINRLIKLPPPLQTETEEIEESVTNEGNE